MRQSFRSFSDASRRCLFDPTLPLSIPLYRISPIMLQKPGEYHTLNSKYRQNVYRILRIFRGIMGGWCHSLLCEPWFRPS